MDLLDRLLGHDHWATTRILEHSRDLTDAQLNQPFELGLGTLHETLVHLVFVIDFWGSQMAGHPFSVDHDSKPPVGELTELHERLHASFAEFARRAHDEQRLDETFVDYFNNRQSLGGTIVHVCHHSAQHRAEVRHMLERLGVLDLWDLDPQEWEHASGAI